MTKRMESGKLFALSLTIIVSLRIAINNSMKFVQVPDLEAKRC